MARAVDFEKAIRGHGAIKISEFTTRAGLPANCKIEVDDQFLKSNQDLADQIAENLANQMASHEPKLIVPVPRGANYLGELVAKQMQICYLAVGKTDEGTFHIRTSGDRAKLSRTESIGIVDDVFTTGSALRDLSSLPEFEGRVVTAGVVWDRSDSGKPKKLDFDLVSVVEKYVPLWVEVDS